MENPVKGAGSSGPSWQGAQLSFVILTHPMNNQEFSKLIRKHETKSILKSQKNY